MLECIRPECRQYFLKSAFSGRPFNRMPRTVIEHSAMTEEDIAEPYALLWQAASATQPNP